MARVLQAPCLRAVLAFGLIFPNFPAAAADAAAGKSLAIATAHAFVDETLTVDAAVELVGANKPAEQSGQYWVIRTGRGDQQIILHALTRTEPAADAEIHLGLEAGVVLADVEAAFGRWTLVHASVDTSVKFEATNEQGRSAEIYATLFGSRPAPEAQVTKLKLWRVKP